MGRHLERFLPLAAHVLISDLKILECKDKNNSTQQQAEDTECHASFPLQNNLRS